MGKSFKPWQAFAMLLVITIAGILLLISTFL